MKQAFYVGVFTYDAECVTAIREYSSLNNAEKFFKKYCEKNGHKVISSSASHIENFASFDEFSHKVLDSGFLTLKTFYPERYYELFRKQSEDK